uniref:Uncharacterized protein n=1 Tax=Tanacetum cinerariifolium TaxID=118510 RepID=A0A699HNC3_TANCI|nr:hypothetical protein [Tanacetum cinerariifolium]
MGCDEEIDDILRIRLCKAGSDEEIFTLVAWMRVLNINELIYAEFCHEFYSTCEFNKVCADDELQTTKIVKFRLGGRAHSLTLLEFSQRLGLYQAVKLEDEGFNVYFEGALRSDEHFNAQEYWMGRVEIRQEAIEWMEYGSHITGTGTGRECLCLWLGFMVFYCREPTTHLVMLSRNMTSIISSTHLRHHSIHHSISSSSMMMMSSVKTT